MRLISKTRTLVMIMCAGLAWGNIPSVGAETLPTVSEAIARTQHDLEQAGLPQLVVDPQVVAEADAAIARVQADLDRVAGDVDSYVATVQQDLQRVSQEAEYAVKGIVKGMPQPGTSASTKVSDSPATNPTVSKNKPFVFGSEDLKKVGKDFEPIYSGPFYHWRTDALSKFLAGTNTKVLHRAPGSWFDAPRVPAASLAAEREGFSLYGPSTPILAIEDAEMCTVAATGFDNQGRMVAITAGHCGEIGSKIVSLDSWRVGKSGTVVAHGSQGLDYSVIELAKNAQVSKTYNNTTFEEIGGEIPDRSKVCKSGVATGTTCGYSLWSTPKTTIAQVCATRGDSGAPLIANGRWVGVVTSGVTPTYALACNTPLQGWLFQPTRSLKADAIVKDLNARGGVGAGFTLPTK